MVHGTDKFVIDDSVIVRALLEPQGAAADVLRHLAASPVEIGYVPDCVAAWFYDLAATGLVLADASGITQVRRPAHVIARWQAAHNNLFANTVAPPSGDLPTDPDIRESLREVIATARELGADRIRGAARIPRRCHAHHVEHVLRHRGPGVTV